MVWSLVALVFGLVGMALAAWSIVLGGRHAQVLSRQLASSQDRCAQLTRNLRDIAASESKLWVENGRLRCKLTQSRIAIHDLDADYRLAIRAYERVSGTHVTAPVSPAVIEVRRALQPRATPVSGSVS